MSYTRRDYTTLAQALASSLSDARHTDISAKTAMSNVIYDIAEALAKLNPRFDRERFITATGLARPINQAQTLRIGGR